jgi:hypothetical protein
MGYSNEYPIKKNKNKLRIIWWIEKSYLSLHYIIKTNNINN